MARLVRAIPNPVTVWMARIKRAMTVGEGKEYVVVDGDGMHFRFKN
jgi:hypothetical protein